MTAGHVFAGGRIWKIRENPYQELGISLAYALLRSPFEQALMKQAHGPP
jgi:hypothetical protein